HRVIGRSPAGPAAFEQARLEPAAVLVTAFKVKVGGPTLLGPVPTLQGEDVGTAAVEPDVENVGHHLIIVGIAVAEKGGCVFRVPGIDAAPGDGFDDALVDFMVDQR